MKSFKEFLEENKNVGKFTTDYSVQLKPAQKDAVKRALESMIKMYMIDGYDVTLTTLKDADRGIAVLLYIKKGKGFSTLVAHKSMGPHGKLVDVFNP